MDKNVRNDEQVTTVKRDYHTPELRLHGKVGDITRDSNDDPYDFSDGIECWS